VRGVGREITLRYVITEIEMNSRVAVRAVTSSLRSVDVMNFVENEGGCLVTYDASLVGTGVLAVINPVLALVFRRIGDRAASGLRAALQATAA
jgi:uncharacterized membrane protein YhaH (DUF805 family)